MTAETLTTVEVRMSNPLAGVERLGIAGDDLTGLAALVDDGNCAAVQARMERLVRDRLTATQTRIVELIERAARLQSGAPVGISDEVAGVQARIVELGAKVGPLQAAAARLAEPTRTGACDDGCPCVTAASTVTRPRTPASRIPMAASAIDADSQFVCTIDGGADAMHDRIAQWQAVIGRATGREPADGGVTLVFDHDRELTVELARLGADEFACCSFFTFTLTVGPPGVRFTVTAPNEARDALTSVFGTAEPAHP